MNTRRENSDGKSAAAKMSVLCYCDAHNSEIIIEAWDGCASARRGVNSERFIKISGVITERLSRIILNKPYWRCREQPMACDRE